MAHGVLVMFSFDDGDRNALTSIKNIIGTLGATLGFWVLDPSGKFAADHDTAIGQLHFLTKLVLLPASLLDSRSNELGADVSL